MNPGIFRFRKLDLLYLMLFIPFFEPAYIGHNIPILHRLFRYGAYASTLLIGLLYVSSIARSKKKKITVPIRFAVLYSTTVFFSTILNSGDIKSCLVEGVSLISLFVLSDLICRKSVIRFLTVIFPIFYILVVINFISMLLYPKGMYLYVMEGDYHWASNFNWFLGLENAMIIFLLPTLVYSILIYLYNNNKWNLINCLLVSVICIYIPVVRWKAASIVCFALFFAVTVLSMLRIAPNILNARTYVTLNVFLFLFLVIFGIQGGIVAYIAETILHKSDTLGIRMNIWGIVLEMIQKRPILGYGYETASAVSSKMTYNSAHNQYLWTLYRGGLIQFSIFLWFIWKIASKLFTHRRNLGVKIVSIGMCVALLMWQTEAIVAYPLMTFLVFSYYFVDNEGCLAQMDKCKYKKRLSF